MRKLLLLAIFLFALTVFAQERPQIDPIREYGICALSLRSEQQEVVRLQQEISVLRDALKSKEAKEK